MKNNPLYKFYKGKRIAVLGMKKCPVCNKQFVLKQSKSKYCSRKCYYEMKKQRGDRVFWTDEMRKLLSKKYMGSGNPMFGTIGYFRGKKRLDMQGENHPLWKGGKSKHNQGYIIHESQKYTNGSKILEHRLFLEKYLNRKLLLSEIVHHINGDKIDNRIENLEIVDRSKHMKMHMKQIQMGRVKKY